MKMSNLYRTLYLMLMLGKIIRPRPPILISLISLSCIQFDIFVAATEARTM